MEKHTPTPWHTDDDDTVRAPNGFIVARINEFAESFCDKMHENNAALIVRAVNSHDDLVAALRKADAELERRGYDPGNSTRIVVLAALAKAES